MLESDTYAAFNSYRTMLQMMQRDGVKVNDGRMLASKRPAIAQELQAIKDRALIKLVYIAYRNARKKWTMPVPNWGIISQQLAIKFEDRYNLL